MELTYDLSTRRGHLPSRNPRTGYGRPCDLLLLVSMEDRSMAEEKVAQWRAAALVDGELIFLPRPARHHHIRDLIVERYGRRRAWIEAETEQGFVDDQNKYMTREAAGLRYEAAGHIMRWPPQLFSEDLWTNEKL